MPSENDTSLTLGPAGIDDEQDDVDETETDRPLAEPANQGVEEADDVEESDEDGDEPQSRKGADDNDDQSDALEEARAQAALAELNGAEREQADSEDEEPRAKPKPKPNKPASPKPEAEDDETEIKSLVEDFGIDKKQAEKIVERQSKRVASIAKQAVEEAIAPFRGIFEDSKRRAAQEYTQSVDRSLDEWAKRSKAAGIGESAKLKGPERLMRAVLVREAQKLVNGLPKSARDSVTDDALFAAAYPAAEFYMKLKGFKIGGTPPKSTTTKPQSQANGSVTRPPGSLPGASAASAQRPGGRTQSSPARIPSQSTILAKMRAVRDAQAS